MCFPRVFVLWAETFGTIMKKIAIISVASIFAIALGALLLVLFANFSNGSRAGTIAKFSHKGVMIKTWEGQLLTGGMSGSDGGDLVSSHWEFSVYRGDDPVLRAIEKAMDGGYRVKLHYEEKFFQFGWRGDTKYFVTKVEKVGE